MSITQGVTQHTTMTEKNVDTPHTVAELRDWLMVESRDSVSLVNLLISLPSAQCTLDYILGRIFLNRIVCGGIFLG